AYQTLADRGESTLRIYSITPLPRWQAPATTGIRAGFGNDRSEEHTSELQSRGHLVCRLLLEKKKIKKISTSTEPKIKLPYKHYHASHKANTSNIFLLLSLLSLSWTSLSFTP